MTPLRKEIISEQDQRKIGQKEALTPAKTPLKIGDPFNLTDNPMHKRFNKDGSSLSSEGQTVKMKASSSKDKTADNTESDIPPADASKSAPPIMLIENPDENLFMVCTDANNNQFLVTLRSLLHETIEYPRGTQIPIGVARNVVTDQMSDVTSSVEKRRRARGGRKKKDTQSVARDISYNSSMTQVNQAEVEAEKREYASVFNKYFKKNE